jgi:hypothetical protein
VDAVEVSGRTETERAALLASEVMERVRAHAWVKGPFYQFKRRLAEQAAPAVLRSDTATP